MLEHSLDIATQPLEWLFQSRLTGTDLRPAHRSLMSPFLIITINSHLTLRKILVFLLTLCLLVG